MDRSVSTPPSLSWCPQAVDERVGSPWPGGGGEVAHVLGLCGRHSLDSSLRLCPVNLHTHVSFLLGGGVCVCMYVGAHAHVHACLFKNVFMRKQFLTTF